MESQRTNQKKGDSQKWVKSNKTQVKGEGEQLKGVTGTYDYVHTCGESWDWHDYENEQTKCPNKD